MIFCLKDKLYIVYVKMRIGITPNLFYRWI